MAGMTVRLMGLMERYPQAAPGGVLVVDIDPSDSVAELMQRVGERVGPDLLPGLWNADDREFHHAVHVFLDGERVENRGHALGQSREATFLLQVVGG